jgi:hypothetical protein
MPDPKLSDPGGTPRFHLRGECKRQKPIWTREQFGPWRCDVRVTPITGVRQTTAVFEINCQWHRGPALDRSLGPAPPGGMAASDVYVVDPAARDMMLREAQAAELAQQIARAAADILAAGRRPNLPKIARDLRRRL